MGTGPVVHAWGCRNPRVVDPTRLDREGALDPCAGARLGGEGSRVHLGWWSGRTAVVFWKGTSILPCSDPQ